MATAFPRALSSNPEVDAYQALMQELQSPQKISSGPMFSPEEVQRRVAQNNQLLQLGVIGTVAADEGVNRAGGQVFRQSLADRNERQTDRGIQDPLTGETRIDPIYAEGQERARRGQVLQQALGFQKSRAEAADRNARAREAHEARLAEISARGEFQKTIAGMRGDGRGSNKPPVGFRFTPDGDLEPIPGGPAAIKLGGAETKAVAMEDSIINTVDRVLGAADEVRNMAGATTTGLPGKYIGMVPGTGAYDMRRTVDNIKANLGFNELAAMRQASPTGGALGQVAVKELEFLQATVANLDPNQSEQMLRKNLDKISDHYNRWKETVLRNRAQRASAPGYTPPVSGGTDVPQAVPPSTQPQPPATPVAPQAPTSPRVRLKFDPQTGKFVNAN